MALDEYLLAVLMTSAVVIIGVILFASLLGRSSVSETLRDLYRTYFGGDDDLPSGGDLNAKIDPKSYTDPADKASADAAKNEDDCPPPS